MVQRVHYRRQFSYNTRSNKVKTVRTPGGRLVVHHIRKVGTLPKCGDCKEALHGIPKLRPREYSRIAKCKRTVARTYGGSLCASCVRSRILRSFLLEEQKIVQKVMKEKEAKEKASQ